MTITTHYVNIALGCFFSGANQVRWWRLEYLMFFFALWVDWLIDFFEEREKAMCQLVGGQQKM